MTTKSPAVLSAAVCCSKNMQIVGNIPLAATQAGSVCGVGVGRERRGPHIDAKPHGPVHCEVALRLISQELVDEHPAASDRQGQDAQGVWGTGRLG